MTEVFDSVAQHQLNKLQEEVGLHKQEIADLRGALKDAIAIVRNLCGTFVSLSESGSELAQAIEDGVEEPLRGLATKLHTPKPEPAADPSVHLFPGPKICSIKVGPWHGPGNPGIKAIGLLIKVNAATGPQHYIFRLASAEAVARLIRDLQRVAQRAWPDAPPAAHAACDEGEATP